MSLKPEGQFRTGAAKERSLRRWHGGGSSWSSGESGAEREGGDILK